MEADLSDKQSLEKAFKGAYGVFAVTDFWATMSADIEVEQGRNVGDAAKVRRPPIDEKMMNGIREDGG